jgi:hypothetical protein
MLIKLLSGDTPRSGLLAVLLLVILISLAFAPFLFPGTKSLETAAKICIFIVWWRAMTCFWAMPASSLSHIPCSSGSAPMVRHWPCRRPARPTGP